MQPLELLREECSNVKVALEETLRYDYLPEQSVDFYRECAYRLKKITDSALQVAAGDAHAIAAHIGALGYISSLVSLIERSRLGEFSWPFANELRILAKSLLSEAHLLGGSRDLIIHVVADGRDYYIHTEDAVQSAISHRRFAVVLFPRPLKYHVLLHAIFGHELGHAALQTTVIGNALQENVCAALAVGPMADDTALSAWLNSPDAPQEVKTAMANYALQQGRPFRVTDETRLTWLRELICDLFGLLLFGPSFLAAHRSIIGPKHPNPFKIEFDDATHPPYAVRHKLLVHALRIQQWHKTITLHADGPYHDAELEFLTETISDPFPAWTSIFSDSQLQDAIKGILRPCRSESI